MLFAVQIGLYVLIEVAVRGLVVCLNLPTTDYLILCLHLGPALHLFDPLAGFIEVQKPHNKALSA